MRIITRRVGDLERTEPPLATGDSVAPDLAAANGGSVRVSIVIPFRDEAPTLRPLYLALTDVLESRDIPFELLFVDDGSMDASVDILSDLAGRDPRLRILQLRRNFGKAGALATGFREARGQIVVTIDADLQDDPAEIPAVIAKLRAGYDLVSGWRQDRRDRFGRRIASRLFNKAVSRLCRVRLHDINCGLKGYSRECAREIAHSCYGELHRFLPILAHWRGYRVTEIPVNHRERLNGRSRYGVERYARAFLDFLTVLYMARYRHRSMHLFGGIGLVLFLAGSASVFYLVLSKVLLGHSLSDRPLLILGSVLCIAGLQLVLAGLLAETVSGAHPEQVPYARVVVLPEAEELDDSADGNGGGNDQADADSYGRVPAVSSADRPPA